jgi:hypothetical protein
VHFPKAARSGRKILRKRENLPPIYISKACDDSVSGYVNLIDSEKGPPVFHKHVKFTEAAGIEKIIQTVPGGHLPAFKLLGHGRWPSHFFDLGFILSKFFQFVRDCSHTS